MNVQTITTTTREPATTTSVSPGRLIGVPFGMPVVTPSVVKPSVAVLGCGYWGKNLVRNVHELGALTAVVDPSPGGFSKAFGTAESTDAPTVPLYSDADAVLSDRSINAVMIATPAETHYAVALEALEAGKDVFVEKPLAVNLDQGRHLVQRARELDRILMVGHLLEYHPAILKLRELVDLGALGKIRYVISNRLNLGKIRTEENALWSFAPHDIAVILRLVGEMPFEVVATGGSYVSPNIADVTVTQLLFNNGVRSHVFVSWLHPFKEQKLVVVGSKQMASYDDITKELIVHDQRVDWHEGQPVPVRGAGTRVAFDSDEPLRRECEHFLNCVATRSRPLTDGASGLDVLRVLNAAQRSLVTNGHPVRFEVA